MILSSSAGSSGFSRTADVGAASRMALKMTAELSPRNGGMRGRHFVEHGAEREQVAASIDFFRARLLGRHISGGAEGGAVAGEMLFVDRGVVRSIEALARRIGRGHDLRDSEVENLGVATLGDKDVGGLDVPMNDASGMSGVERIGDLDRQAQQGFGFQRTVRRSDASGLRPRETPWR